MSDVLNKMTVKITNLARAAGYSAGGEVSIRSGTVNTNGEMSWTASFGSDSCNGHDPYTAVQNLYFRVKARVEQDIERYRNTVSTLENSIRENSL